MEKENANLLLTEEALENLEKAAGAIKVTSVLPGTIAVETLPHDSTSRIYPEKEIEKIRAPRPQQYRGSNITIGRPKNFLKARKKRQKMAKKSRRNNRRKK